MNKAFLFFSAFIFMALLGLSFRYPAAAPLKELPTEPGHETIPQKYFIKDSFFLKYGLVAGEINNHMKIWNGTHKTSKFSRVCDIRFEFDDKKAATKYFNNNLKRNSEDGEEIFPKIDIPGAKELHFYKESKKMAEMNKSFGLKLPMYYFLYVIDNVCVKVFVAGYDDTSIADASVFGIEAARSIQSAKGK